MEEPRPAFRTIGDEERGLKGLVDAFGMMFPCEKIVSAYAEAGNDVDAAGLILYDSLGASSSSNPDVGSLPNGDVSEGSSSRTRSHDTSHEPNQENGGAVSSRLKLPPASVGTVSSSLGKDYIGTKPSARRYVGATEPLKLDAGSLPKSELCVKEDKVQAKAIEMHKEMEDFLFKMLGDGFQLERHVIADVLGKCGYDMQKSMESLFDYSASAAEKRMESCREPPIVKNNRGGRVQQQKKIQQTESQGVRISSAGEGALPRKQDRRDLQREILASLFTSPARDEASPSTPVVPVMALSVVDGSEEKKVESPEKLTAADESNTANSNQDDYDEGEEGSYQSLRKAVQEYRNTMREYYSAAIQAFEAGDQVRMNKLLEKGNFFKQKAREADDESAEKIFQTSKDVDTEDSITLALHEHEPREAMKLLKKHIASLAGNLAFKYLKVIIETADGDTSRGARRRRTMKVLEKDSIEWKEEGTAGTILIPLEDIDPRRLSFGNKR